VPNPAFGARLAADRAALEQRPCIVFQNVGLIDLAAVTTMGVSVKEGDSPIGYFGTGLKFAIATILRMGEEFTLYRGEKAFRFTSEPMEIRGETFGLVHMNGQPLGFTTQLGKNWQPWMAFRELASNCRDEGGDFFRSDARLWRPTAGMTTICVTGDDIAAAYQDRGDILLEGAPIYADEEIEIFEGPSPYVFYRGVRIHRSPSPTALLYNIKTVLELTEDRTAKNSWEVHLRIEQALPKIKDEALLRRLLSCGEGYLEHALDFEAYCHAPSPEYTRTVGAMALGAEAVPTLNPGVAKKARERATASMEPGDGIALSPVQRDMLDRAMGMLQSGGYDVDAFPIVCCDCLGPSIHGLAKGGKIFLSRLAFDKGTRELAATLLEEFAHLRSGQADCTRGFQNWLFDQLLIRVEAAAGEPF
jgi:hypothetical protein